MCASSDDYFDHFTELDDELLASFPMPRDPTAHSGQSDSHGSPDVATGVGSVEVVETGPFYQYYLYYTHLMCIVP
jgi:hypothetical protein